MSLVREARSDDIPDLVALMAEFYAESSFPLPAGAAARTFAALMADPRLGRVWVLESEGALAGYVVLTVGFSMEYGGLRGFVDDLYVRARYRRRGLAAVGLEEVRRAALAAGVRALLVEVGPANEAARRLYARQGFREAGRLLLTRELASPVHAE